LRGAVLSVDVVVVVVDDDDDDDDDDDNKRRPTIVAVNGAIMLPMRPRKDTIPIAWLLQCISCISRYNHHHSISYNSKSNFTHTITFQIQLLFALLCIFMHDRAIQNH